MNKTLHIILIILFIVIISISSIGYYKIKVIELERDYYKDQMILLCWNNNYYQDILDNILDDEIKYLTIDCDGLVISK